MFDRLDWWQILLLLAPIAASMSWVRRRELKQEGIDVASLSAMQKAWVFITLLPPGISATLLEKLSEGERSEVLNQGRQIQGNRKTASLPLLVEFVKFLGEEKKVKTSEPSEVVDYICARYETKPGELLADIRKCWKM